MDVVKVIYRDKGKSHILQMGCREFFGLNDVEKAIVTISKDKNTRSQKQNRLYFKWLTVINQETGMPIKDYFEDNVWHKGLHTGFKYKFLEEIEYDDGDIKPPSSKNLKVEEFKVFLEQVEQEMAMMGIMLPHPEDLWPDAMGVKIGVI